MQVVRNGIAQRRRGVTIDRRRVFSASSSPYAGLVAGYKQLIDANASVYSDAGTTPAVNNDPVYQWNDQSGNLYHFRQTTAGFRPLLKTGQINTYPAILFDATDDAMTKVTAYSPAASFTIFTVYKAASGSAVGRRLVNGFNNWLLGPYLGNYQTYNGNFIDGGAVNTSVYKTHSIVQTAGASTAYLNGSSIGTSVPTTTPGDYNLGALGAFPQIADSYLAFLVAYDSALSAGDLTTVHTWLQTRFGHY